MSGIFGTNLLSPAQRQETVLRKTLELRRQFFVVPEGRDYVYKGAGDLLLKHGKFYSGRELPEAYSELWHHGGGVGQCFSNAYEATQVDPSVRYCEGVYSIGAGVYVPHAWCLDPDGELLEVTLPTDPATIAMGTEERTHEPVLGVDRWGYWGVVIHPDYVLASSELDDGAGVLDRPSHEALESHARQNAEDFEEWREHWPIYTYPYDPERRTP